MTSPIDASIVTTTLPIVTMIVAAIYLKEPITNKRYWVFSWGLWERLSLL